MTMMGYWLGNETMAGRHGLRSWEVEIKRGDRGRGGCRGESTREDNQTGSWARNERARVEGTKSELG